MGCALYRGRRCSPSCACARGRARGRRRARRPRRGRRRLRPPPWRRPTAPRCRLARRSPSRRAARARSSSARSHAAVVDALRRPRPGWRRSTGPAPAATLRARSSPRPPPSPPASGSCRSVPGGHQRRPGAPPHRRRVPARHPRRRPPRQTPGVRPTPRRAGGQAVQVLRAPPSRRHRQQQPRAARPRPRRGLAVGPAQPLHRRAQQRAPLAPDAARPGQRVPRLGDAHNDVGFAAALVSDGALGTTTLLRQNYVRVRRVCAASRLSHDAHAGRHAHRRARPRPAARRAVGAGARVPYRATSTTSRP